ncbi:hypothetical protein Bb109J_c2495 [Bdellovibrio bacteriovorus]|uniref:helix-turn-helix domain-containing protein n=1 Tax=Bdellovibrio bacteriovorus TaxID=959 RepID=UPI00045BE608|nr:helix-turn-helix domain-containing protein [Bdellovibrio bacteriovorus]AHZ85183.1 hypothetical protein EP01_09570 [Bdellovibrio bacteriovorus]BEV69075.1 hypothetical protein Bb109J_c2495 [Bdellovibrio bacteriovorus]
MSKKDFFPFKSIPLGELTKSSSERVQVKKEKNLENMIDKKTLALKISLSISMIDKLIAKGLPHYKIGRMVRFKYGEVMEYFERNKFP